MEKPENIFINRELSWLDFDSRVLALAKEKSVPLCERLKFAAIFGSNMDDCRLSAINTTSTWCRL